MNKKLVRYSIWLLNILVIFIFVWSIVNYKLLNQEASELVQVWGMLAVVSLVIFLEGAPVFVGPSVAIATALAAGLLSPLWLFLIFLGSALAGNAVYYFLGYIPGERILKYFEKNDVKKYREMFRKYGGWAMVIMAVSPIPYMPTLAGVFRMTSPKTIFWVLVVRMARHAVVFVFWLFVLGVI